MAWEPNDLDLRANYDLGVEAGKALREQEIIDMLEELAEVTDYVEIKLDKLIALIKGEK